MAGAGSGDEAGGDMPADGVAAPHEDMPDEKPKEGATTFIPKTALGGKAYKEGDKITLTVEAVDPDTGEVEACLYDGADEGEGGQAEPDAEAAFDDKMPEEPMN